MTITYKDTDGIQGMRVAGRLAAEVLDFLTPHIKPGVTTQEIDRLAAECMKKQGTTSATLGYQPAGYPPYPASLCTSVNHVVCHGIPNDKPLKKGDIVNVDVTVIKDGWYGDTSRMYIVGKPSVLAKRLVDTTYEAMCAGIREVRPGATLGDVGAAIQKVAEKAGFSIVRDYCGHGIGQIYHDDPQVLHFGRRGEGLRLEAGMIFTIEPMVNAGRPETRELADGWTVVTRDGSLSAQWEHMFVVTERGHEVLTPWPEGTGDYPAP